MNAVIKRTSFARGNYVNATAFANPSVKFDPFIATSRLIDKVKTGTAKTDAVLITAVDRPTSPTKAQSFPAREFSILIPADFAVGVYSLQNRDDVAFSFKDADSTVYESVSGKLELEPSIGNNVKGKVDANLDGPNGATFQLKVEFQVLKS